MAERIIFHVDVNSAFLSWESARRVREGKSDLRLVPAAIGGDKDTRRGIILAKSIPAKKYDVKTGEPVGFALGKCPQLVIEKPDFRLYGECSRAFIRICREYAPVVEQFSIDECFLDMTGMELLCPDIVETAYGLKNKIKTELGFTVNIGIGSNKLLAKTASDFEKPDKVHTLFTGEIEEKLWPLPVGDLLFVGASTAEKLNQYGFGTVGDCAKADVKTLQHLLGEKSGLSLHRSANGIDDSPVTEEYGEAKGFSISTTLEDDVVSYAAAEQILLMLAESVTARMRRHGACCRTVGVTVRTLDFKDRSHQKTLPNPTDITDVVYGTAKTLLRELWDGAAPLRLIGISLGKATTEPLEQLSLFPDEKLEKARALDKAVDKIRTKYGASTLTRGSAVPLRTKSDNIGEGKKEK